MDIAELSAFANMLRLWYDLRAANRTQSGRISCEARVYAFPRTAADAIRQALSVRLRDCEVQPSAADELTVIGPTQSTDALPDVAVWREVLSEPLVQSACVLLRLTIEGTVVAMSGSFAAAKQTIVLCGAPASGAIVLKAIWELGQDRSVELLYRLTEWDAEAKLLDAFEEYLRECAGGRAATAAAVAMAAFGNEGDRLFLGGREERLTMWIVRQVVEMPDEHGPAALARRLALPLAGASIFIAVPAVCGARFPTGFICLLIVAGLLLIAWRVAWQKLGRVRRYYKAMRAGLGKLYSKPATYEVIDLSSDRTPTLLKSTAELKSLGARHVCDVKIETAKSVLDGNRVFAIGDATASLGLLRKTDKLVFFPAKPVIILSTRFADGRRHSTTNRPIYRKRSRPQVTARCLPEEGEAHEVFARHRRHVDRLIAAGGVPIPPATNPEQVLERMRTEHEEGREAWQRAPYSWGDALHDAFKICRREYLAE